ncbi:hypothetical protein Lalb_Chr11g0061851 [Lupinus albus]|uniref:Uncharacterized protein n=1 Tax=Lupinus albus TaxID=3870 RepID=A0A6A4PQF9_LUPAL|nr:hypothetical protein Lalb_Chr11g0061851 [Lupinus albus]
MRNGTETIPGTAIIHLSHFLILSSYHHINRTISALIHFTNLYINYLAQTFVCTLSTLVSTDLFSSNVNLSRKDLFLALVFIF